MERTSLEQIISLHEQKKLVGAYRLTNNDYHASPGISKSATDDLAVSPKYYQYRLKNPRKWTEALIFGSAYHCMILQDEPFNSLFYITKTQPRDPAPDEQGRMPLSEKNFEKLKAMKKAFFAEDMAKRAINGLREMCFFWTDQESGVLCKCKPDVLLPNGVVVDLKTASDISDEKLPYAIKDRGYDVQGAFFMDGIHQALEQSKQDIGLKLEPHKFLLCFQEKDEPFDLNVKFLGPNSAVRGESIYRRRLNTYVECAKSGVWYGRTGKTIGELEVSQYHINMELNSSGGA